MTEDELQAIEERASKATPGPWRHYAGGIVANNAGDLVDHDDDCVEGCDGTSHVVEIATMDADYHRDEDVDAPFIAAARTDVPALLAEVRRLRAIGTSCKHRGGTCKWCHGPVGTPRPDHVCESE